MLSIVVVGTLLAASPPALPPEPALGDAAGDALGEVMGEDPDLVAPEAEVEAIVVAPAPLPIAAELEPAEPSVPAPTVVTLAPRALAPGRGVAMQTVPAPPWSGSGRFVGGSIMLIAGTGLLTASAFEYALSRDGTQPLIGNVPAGISMLVAGGVMIGTAARDQRRLGEWEAATRLNARPSGNGLIVAGVTSTSLGIMAAIATSIAMDMNLAAPRSIPAGWATAGLGMGAGTAMLVAGIVRRTRYGRWREGLRGMPMVAPTPTGASLGFVGQF
jgi:hypothetical protein